MTRRKIETFSEDTGLAPPDVELCIRIDEATKSAQVFNEIDDERLAAKSLRQRLRDIGLDRESEIYERRIRAQEVKLSLALCGAGGATAVQERVRMMVEDNLEEVAQALSCC